MRLLSSAHPMLKREIIYDQILSHRNVANVENAGADLDAKHAQCECLDATNQQAARLPLVSLGTSYHAAIIRLNNGAHFSQYLRHITCF
jgi:glucosamine 6-phosphate synthetase-like amidotransferase/phosphosugar isomerase protein